MPDDQDKEKPGKNFDTGPLSASNIEVIPDSPIAVALEDAEDPSRPPTVKAAGRGKIAEQILQLAFEHDIKVRKDSALAEILAYVDLDSPVPTEAFMAVAEILSYVYRANGEPNPFDAVLQDAIDKDTDSAEDDVESDNDTDAGKQ